MDDSNLACDQATLIRSLVRDVSTHAHPVLRFETHLSTVLVAGEFAYKIKKPARFDFADFSTLDARHAFCQEELRLNRRLAPGLYLDVVPVTGSVLEPRLGGSGAPLEYAVRMRAFPQHALWSERIASHHLAGAEIDELARKLAPFHAQAQRAPAGQPWGSAAMLAKIGADSLDLIATLAHAPEQTAAVAQLRAWQSAQHERLGPVFVARKERGFIRECHGDLHCGNILTLKGRVEIFDCIEFSDSLRWIDVINEIAFTCMDLECHGCAPLAARLLSGYLEIGGDYEGLAVLRYYQVECALVRWKVALLRAAQLQGEAAAAQLGRASALMEYATARTAPGQGAIIVMHGFSGSGKSGVANQLVELLCAVRVRSDVERKRMHGIAATGRASASLGAGLYDPAASVAAYERLAELAASVARAGIPALVDGCFLQRGQRGRFEQSARELGVPFLIVDVRAAPNTVRARVIARAFRGDDPSDAGEAVLAHQMAHDEPLAAGELARTVVVDTDSDTETNPDALRAACLALLADSGG